MFPYINAPPISFSYYYLSYNPLIYNIIGCALFFQCQLWRGHVNEINSTPHFLLHSKPKLIFLISKKLIHQFIFLYKTLSLSTTTTTTVIKQFNPLSYQNRKKKQTSTQYQLKLKLKLFYLTPQRLKRTWNNGVLHLMDAQL